MEDAYTPIDNVVAMTKNVSCETRQTDDNSLSSVGLKPESLCDTVVPTQADIRVNSSNYITTNKAIWKHYTAQNIHLENMEFYAVLKTAQMYGIPAAGIFIVTNYCDAHAHEMFKKNHQEAMARLDAYVKEKAKPQ